MTKTAPLPNPDIRYDAAAIGLAEYHDAPLALDIVTEERKRIGVAITPAMLAGLMLAAKDALAVLRNQPGGLHGQPKE